jgi:hypothetical protein
VAAAITLATACIALFMRVQAFAGAVLLGLAGLV